MGSYRRSVVCPLRIRTHAYTLVKGKVDVRRHRYHDHAFSRRWEDARRYASWQLMNRTPASPISPILGILPKLLSALRSAGIVTEDLSLSQDAPDNLEATYRGLCVRPTRTSQSQIRRRLGGCATHSHWNWIDPLFRCRHPCYSLGMSWRRFDILYRTCLRHICGPSTHAAVTLAFRVTISYALTDFAFQTLRRTRVSRVYYSSIDLYA